ncbi:MAG: Clp protease N-terminal domain-containing protein [Rhodococcus sp. (in: high G+C Gram-positive bacteria)]|uniref:Clp protease N-terminal domain-containing protein n=1 Tax=Rhodococcus sp. BS-15 TaxID=1304954 RepID=UPI000B115D44|nr:Clp protease N-terminal domain-containing protein [Rhodococcus sp. BS-15]
MFEKFTAAARLTVIDAQEVAREMGAPRICVEHLLLAALDGADESLKTRMSTLGVASDAVRSALRADSALGSEDARALESIGIDLNAVVSQVDAAFGAGALDRNSEQTRKHLPFDKAAKSALRQSLKEAVALRDREIGVAHVLLGVFGQDELAASSLLPVGVTLDAVRATISTSTP